MEKICELSDRCLRGGVNVGRKCVGGKCLGKILGEIVGGVGGEECRDPKN